MYKIIYSHVLNPVSEEQLDHYSDCGLVLQKQSNGHYRFLELSTRNDIESKYRTRDSKEIQEWPNYYLLPGLIDLHFHWVQDGVRPGPKEDLLAWLKHQTWPHEAQFANKAFSLQQAQLFTQQLLKNGTLGGMVYASSHSHTVDHALEYFIGDYRVGHPLMVNNAPADLLQTPADAKKMLKKYAQTYGDRYVVTPRFALTVPAPLMAIGARFAAEYQLYQQTHLAETPNECDAALELFQSQEGFEGIKSYTEIYERCQILGPRTILAHALYLQMRDWQKIKKYGANIAHCPSSNAPVGELGLGSGRFHFLEADKYQIPWGLGSDIGAGPYLSMFDVITSFVRQHRQWPAAGATLTKGLYKATVANAAIMGLGEVGNFQTGNWANFLVVPRPRKFESDGEKMLQLLLRPYMEHRERWEQLVVKTYFRGNEVYSQ